MDRQGYRVRFARLAIPVVLGLVLISVVGAALYWKHLTSDADIDPSIAQTTTPEIPVNKSDPREDADANEGSQVLEVPPHALDPLLEFARTALAHHCENHRDYRGVLVKQEQVHGKVLPIASLAIKLKYDPPTNKDSSPRTVATYLKTIEPRFQAGREVIWIEGKNDNKLIAHESGLLGVVSVELLPQSRLAMVGNRYPITEIGLEKLLRKLIERGERDKLLGPATVRTQGDAYIGKRKCRLVEIVHDDRYVQVNGQRMEFEFSLAQIYIDDEWQLPLKYASYGWPKTANAPAELLESYAYEDLELNVGLTDLDFDTKNPKYGF